MKLYKAQLGWTDGLSALIFHGQRADVADVNNLTNIFEVAAIYEKTRYAKLKLMLGYIVGVFSRNLAGYSEGHYLLTDKGGRKQHAELIRRAMAEEQVHVLQPGEPRGN